MDKMRSELIQDIQAAFPNQILPQNGIAWWEDGVSEDEEVRNQLRGRSVDSISDAEIREIPVCFLTDHVKAMVLPVVMLENLRRGQITRVGELLLDPLPTHIPRIEGLASHLTSDQCKAVARYLEYGCSLGDETSCRAKEFWQRFLTD